jgi:hypothetical protein
MFAAGVPLQPHSSSFCNASAAALAAAAAAAAVAAQQHPDQHGARHHQLPPLLLQELQRQASAPLGQLSPLGLHMPASPLTPVSTAAGWEGLLSPVAAQHRAACQQQQLQQHLQQQEQQSRQQAAAWGQAGGSVSPAALAAAAMAATLQATPQQGQDMAASLQYANLQLAYAAAWQSQQQQPQQQQHAAAAAMLQQQLSGQLASSGVLGEHQHLLGARSMPSDLSGLAAADAFLQQAAAAHNRQQAQQQQLLKPNATTSSSRGNALMPSSGAGSYGSGTPSTPFAAHRHTLLAPDTGTSAGSSVSHADSCTGVPDGRHIDQASAAACARRSSTGALAAAAAAAAAGGGGTHSGGKASDLQQQQKQQVWGGDSILHSSGKADRAPPSPAQQQQSMRRQSSHPLAVRGYSGSDDTAHPVPDVDSLAAGLAAVMRLQQQQQQRNGDAAAGTASMPYPLSLAWNAAAQQASQLSPELLSVLESAASAAASGGGCGSPLHSAVAAMHEQLLLAAGSAGGHASAFAQGQQQQQQQQHSTGAGRRQHSNSELLAAGQFARSFTSPGALTTTPFAGGGALDGVAEHTWQRQWGDAAGSGTAVASEAFKQKHRMQLQLPAHAAAPVSAPLPACSMAGFQQRQAGSGVEQMLITTEVLPESPVAHVPALASSAGQRQQQQYAAGGGSGLDAAGVVGSSTAWADWSASMAALLSPAHVSSLAGRKFTDLLPLPSGVGQQQQQSDGAGATSSSRAAWLLQQGSQRATDQRQPGVDALLAAADEDAASGLGKTRHASLCLDSRPVFTAGQQASCAAAGAGGAGGGGSFSFQPPTLHGTRLAGGSSSSSMICQPFQLPDFFSRYEGSRATGGSAPGCSSSSGRDSARSPLRPSAMEPQGLRLAEGSYSVDLGACADAATARAGGLDDPTGCAPGSPLGAACAARNLQHSFSMPARFCSAPGGPSCDALAAAAAAAIADAAARSGGSDGGDGSATAASQAPIW